MGALFVIGSLWFWLLAIAAVCIIVTTTELEEANSWGFVVVIGTLTLMYFGGNQHSFREFGNYIVENPKVIIGSVVGYLVLGVVWSIVKWFIYLKGQTQRINEYGISYGVNDIYDVSKNKQRILNWMMYWPFSGLWTLIDEPFRKFFKHAFYYLEKTYQRMADNAKKGLKDKK